MPANPYNFAQRAYQIKQAHGITTANNAFNYQLNVKMGNIVDSVSGIGVVDSFYSDEASNSDLTNVLGTIQKYQTSLANNNQSAQDLINTTPGPVMPRVDISNSGTFGGSCYPVSLGNSTTWDLRRDPSSTMFVTGGFNGSKYEISVWVVDPNTNTPQFISNIALGQYNLPGTQTLSTTNMRIFASEAYDDSNLMLSGGQPRLRYITLFVWEYDPNTSDYMYQIETFAFDTNTNILGQVTSYVLNTNLLHPLNYSGKHDIMYPSRIGVNSGLTRLYFCPDGSQNIYSFDIVTGALATQSGQAMAYSIDSNVVCIADRNTGAFGAFLTFSPFLQPIDTAFINNVTGVRFFDGDWSVYGVDPPPASGASDMFYFGDIGSGNGTYRGWSVLIDSGGNILNARYNPIQGSPGTPYHRIMAAAPNYCIWTVGPNYSNYQMVRVSHVDGWYKNYILRDFGTDSYNEDATIMSHPSCMDFSGSIGYNSGVLAGLSGGAGNGHPITTTYNNHVWTFTKNYCYRSQQMQSNVSFGQHHNYILPVGTGEDPSNPQGTVSYYYIAITGLNATYGGTNGSFNIIKFWGP